MLCLPPVNKELLRQTSPLATCFPSCLRLRDITPAILSLLFVLSIFLSPLDHSSHHNNMLQCPTIMTNKHTIVDPVSFFSHCPIFKKSLFSAKLLGRVVVIRWLSWDSRWELGVATGTVAHLFRLLSSVANSQSFSLTLPKLNWSPLTPSVFSHPHLSWWHFHASVA